MISVVPAWGWTLFLLGMLGVGLYTLGAVIFEMFRKR